MSDLVYDDNSIVTIQNLDFIRTRPTGYIPGRGIEGQRHTLWEIISNSVDEMILQPEAGAIYCGVMCDQQHGTYQFFCKDSGRGIPANRIENVITVTGTSGKIKNSAYVASGGQFGMGAKVAAALSTRYRIISRNYLEKETVSLSLRDGKISKKESDQLYDQPAGVITVVELDLKQFFHDGDLFMTAGYLDLCNICRELNVFNPNLDFEFYWYDRLLPEKFWEADTAGAVEIINDAISVYPHTVVYSSPAVADKSHYLFEMWKVKSSEIWRDAYHKDLTNAQDRLGFDVKLFFVKKAPNAQYFISVNNVALPDKTDNSATTAFMAVLRAQLAKYIPEENLKNFLENEYRFPTMLLAIGIRYHGAELSGMTKTSFKNSEFADQFSRELQAIFDQRGHAYWQRCADTLKPDIQFQYARYYDTPVTKSDGRKVFTKLHFATSYQECEGGTGHDELYLVEGRSAGNIVATRDINSQAIYQTRGKPTNFATRFDQMGENRRRLLKDWLYQDLMQILNIGPNTTDMSVSRFSKIIIATDADPDGYHIATLHLNNLYILNPRIIESGMVWIANPPLYSVDFSDERRLFLRDKLALQEALINFAYKPMLEVAIRTCAGVIPNNPELEREMWYLVEYFGNLFSQVSKQLDVPLLVLERLVLAMGYMVPTPDYPKIIECFASKDPSGYVRVTTMPEERSIVVSIGDADYPISIDAATKIIMSRLMPAVKHYGYRDLEFLVRSKLPNSAWCDGNVVSMMGLYLITRNIAKKLKISRYKGLGQMPKESCRNTIMNPATRSMTQVTSVGDAHANYKLLGTDSSGRKDLLVSDSAAISYQFNRHERRANRWW